MQVREILDVKGHDFWSVGPDTSVYDALRLMTDNEVGSVLVVEDGRVRGIVTERDYVRKVVMEGKSSPAPLFAPLGDRCCYICEARLKPRFQ